MDVYKDYIQQLTKLSFCEVYILIGENVIPKLKHFVYLLSAVKFEANSYFSLYGEFKKIISSFLIFHGHSADEIIKEADKCKHVMDKETLLNLFEETISTHESNQIDFAKEFLPVKNAEEKRIYEEIESEFNDFMKRMYQFRACIKKVDKQEMVDNIAEVHFERAVSIRCKILTFTHVFIAMMLADRLDQIRVSIEEICQRMTNNLNQLENDFESSVNSLLQKLYDKNKEGLMQLRRERKSSIQNAEVLRGIQKVREKIDDFESETSLQRLQDEVAYWKDRVKDFHVIRDNLVKLKAEQDETIKQEKIYNSLRSCDPPGTKRQCWKNMGLNYAERKKKLKEMIIHEARALITFFAVRGYDRILYEDNKGYYYVDEFKHQIYVSDYMYTLQHVNCDGELYKVKEKPYYFDKNGRYIYENGEKIYQCAPCTSHYKLTEDNLLKKVSKDCGHSEIPNTKCRMEIKDPNIAELLPDFLPMDIKKTLSPETVKYLWDSFGSLLPDALCDVCLKKPRNPIHMLAHRLLFHKYSRTTEELEEKKKEADQYRLDIYKKRHEKAAASSKVWKSKQPKRRKPEESDDAQDGEVFNAQQAERDLVNYLNYYNYEL